eukprot:1228382-Amphidinium_carterae.3
MANVLQRRRHCCHRSAARLRTLLGQESPGKILLRELEYRDARVQERQQTPLAPEGPATERVHEENSNRTCE